MTIMLLRGQSWCSLRKSSMTGLQCCLGTNQPYNAGFLVPFPARGEGIRPVGSSPAGSRPESQTHLFLYKRRDQSTNKQDPGLSDFIRKLTKDPFLLNHQPKLEPVSSGLATLVAEIQSRRDGVQVSASVKPIRQDDDFDSLCEEGHLDKAFDVLLRMELQGTVPLVKMYRSLFKACAKRKGLSQAKRAHAHISGLGLESSKMQFLGESAVSTLVKCGGLEDALEVFQGLPRQTVFSWTALISGYSTSGQAKKALGMYQQMQEEGVQPNAYTLVALLKSCGRLGDLKEGQRIHAEAAKYRLESDLFVRTCLVDMYGKCGSIVDAQNAFDGLAQPDRVSWNAMLAACAQQDEPAKALWLYDRMQQDGVSPNNRTFVSIVQACGILADKEGPTLVGGRSIKLKALEKGRKIHADARRIGCDKDVFVGSTLISMYGKCGDVLDAQNVFDRLSQRTVVSWNAMLAAYIEHGHAMEALQLYDQMTDNVVRPDDRTFVSALRACGMLAEGDGDVQPSKVQWLEKGRAIHADIQRMGYDSDVFVCSSLLSMYGKCGSLLDAQNVFERLSQRDVVSWNAMIAACTQLAQADKALWLYQEMLEEGVSPTVRTCVSALQACSMLADGEEDLNVNGQRSKVRSLVLGRSIHAYSQVKGFDQDVFVGNTLVSMYGKCGSVMDAQNMFDMLSLRDLVSWNVMLVAHVEQGQHEKVLQMYEQLLEEGGSPDAWTFVSAIQAYSMLAEREEYHVMITGLCTKLDIVEKVKVLHGHAQGKGYHTDVFVGNALVSTYGKCGSIEDAKKAFDGISQQDVVAWNSLLAAYIQEGQAEEALHVYIMMQEKGIDEDAWTFVGALQACGILAEQEEESEQCIKAKSLQEGRALHEAAQRNGYDSDVFVSTTLVSMYGKCGSVADAENVFNGLSHKGVESWNAMLAAYVQEGQGEKALQLWRQMQERGVSADDITVLCILQACSNTGSLAILRHIHDTLISTRNDLSPTLASALISAYGRCASMEDARAVFNALPRIHVVSWNALIAGYAREGNYTASLQCYEEMHLGGMQPNKVTFLCLLSTCSHAGLVDKGVEFFESMSRNHGITPEVAHYASMVDLFGRAGCFTKLQDLLATMPLQPNLGLWLCLLAACQKHGMVDLGKQAFDCAVRLQPRDAAAYVLMSNIYADAGMWIHAKKMDARRQKEGARKKPGQSWIELEQETYNFVVGDDKHSQQADVYELLAKMKVKSISPGTRVSLYLNG